MPPALRQLRGCAGDLAGSGSLQPLPGCYWTQAWVLAEPVPGCSREICGKKSSEGEGPDRNLGAEVTVLPCEHLLYNVGVLAPIVHNFIGCRSALQ